MHGKTIWAYYCIQNLFRQRIPVVPLWDVLELRRMMYDYDMGRADSADYYDVKYLFLKIPAEVTHQVRQLLPPLLIGVCGRGIAHSLSITGAGTALPLETSKAF